MEAAVKLGWKQLPDAYRPQLPTLAEAIGKQTGLHLVWSAVLDEVQGAIRQLEIEDGQN